MPRPPTGSVVTRKTKGGTSYAIRFERGFGKSRQAPGREVFARSSKLLPGRAFRNNARCSLQEMTDRL